MLSTFPWIIANSWRPKEVQDIRGVPTSSRCRLNSYNYLITNVRTQKINQRLRIKRFIQIRRRDKILLLGDQAKKIKFFPTVKYGTPHRFARGCDVGGPRPRRPIWKFAICSSYAGITRCRVRSLGVTYVWELVRLWLTVNWRARLITDLASVDLSTLMSPLVLCTRGYLRGLICLLHEQRTSVCACRIFSSPWALVYRRYALR